MAHGHTYEINQISKLNEEELNRGVFNLKVSWHNEFRDSSYIHVGGLHLQMSEGDVITVFSQFGQITDCNLVRDRNTGKPKGFAFISFEDQQSTILAVDNMNSYQLLGKLLKVNHVKESLFFHPFSKNPPSPERTQWEIGKKFRRCV